MQATGIDASLFNRAIRSCSDVVGWMQDKGVIARLTAAGESLCLEAAVSGVEVRCALDARVEAEGSVCLDLDHVTGLHLNGKTVTIKGVKNKIELASGRNRYTLQPVAGTVQVTPPKKHVVALAANILQQASKAVSFTHDEGGTNEIRFIFGKGALHVESADDYRGIIYRRKMPWKEGPEVVLPISAAKSVLSVFDKTDQVGVNVTETQIQLFHDTAYVAFPVVTAGGLPKVNTKLKSLFEALGGTPSIACVVSAAALEDAAKASTKIASDKDKLDAAVLKLSFGTEKLLIAAAGDIATFRASLPYEGGSLEGKGEAHVLVKSFREMVDVAKSATTETLKLEVWADKAVVLRSVGADYKTIYAFPQAVV